MTRGSEEEDEGWRSELPEDEKSQAIKGSSIQLQNDEQRKVNNKNFKYETIQRWRVESGNQMDEMELTW